MVNYGKWLARLGVLPVAVGIFLSGAASVQAATFGVNTAGCTGSHNCTQETWGVDLNEGTGYSWTVNATSAYAANIYLKVASISGSRSMSLWVNNVRIATVTTTSTLAPRPTGLELAPYNAQLISGNNIIELRDTESSTEFDVHQLRVEVAATPTLNLNLTNTGGRVYINEAANLTASASSGTGWQYQWKLIADGTYDRKDIHGLTWSSAWTAAQCQENSFGQRISAKLYPPANGMYKFAVAADDMHELRITKNGVKQLITSSTQAVTPGNFSNQSQLIELSANTVYPLEFLYINTGNLGHFSVLWQKPGSSQWEEVPPDVFSKPEQTSVSGLLLQETFKQPLSSFSQLTALSSFINSRSNASTAVFTGQNISFTPAQNKNYSFEVTATSGAVTIKNTISFFAEGRFISEDNASASTAWTKIGTTDTNLLSLMKLTTVNDGSATGKVLEIGAPNGGSTGKWTQTVYLKPYTAYELRARVRLLNAPATIEIPSGITDSARLWQLPRIRVGVHGDASQQGINAAAPGTWQDVAVDFIVPFHGAVDLYLQMDKAGNGFYSGTFQIDNLRIEKLTGSGVTQFEFPNLSANIYDEFVTKTGGVQKTKDYFNRLSRAAENMRELSGKNFVAECAKENIFVPKQWDVFALGTNFNGMILKNKSLLTDDFLANVWGSSNIVGGVMIHEIEHSFDFPDSNFNSHLPLLMQVYAMEKDNLLRTSGNNYATAAQWIAEERANKSICSMDPSALLPKLYQYQDLLALSGDKWKPFKQVLHDRWSPYKTIVEGRQWPGGGQFYNQYRMWWDQLKSYTGVDGWTLLHTASEQSAIEAMFARMDNPIQATLDPIAFAGDSLYLNKAVRTTTSIGYGDIDINALVPVSGQCKINNIYAHAPSTITYQLNKKWLAFNTQAVIKDNSVPGRVIAKIKGDNNAVLYQSSDFTAQTSPVTPSTIDVSNTNQLTLEFDAYGTNDSDWSVWIDPALTRAQQAASNFASSGKVIKHSSGKCLAPQSGGIPAMNEKAVLSSDCSSSNVKFKYLASGAIMHINSGACLHPNGGSATPTAGTYWVFFPNCDAVPHIQYDQTTGGSIKHRSSASCIHPEGGSVTPAAGTPAVFDNGCDQERLRFTFE